MVVVVVVLVVVVVVVVVLVEVDVVVVDPALVVEVEIDGRTVDDEKVVTETGVTGTVVAERVVVLGPVVGVVTPVAVGLRTLDVVESALPDDFVVAGRCAGRAEPRDVGAALEGTAIAPGADDVASVAVGAKELGAEVVVVPRTPPLSGGVTGGSALPKATGPAMASHAARAIEIAPADATR